MSQHFFTNLRKEAEGEFDDGKGNVEDHGEDEE